MQSDIRVRRLESTILIAAEKSSIWNEITNVRIEAFTEPWFFRLLGIPKPLSAEVLSEGVGGRRIAYFKNKKRFMQEITVWKYLDEYSFTFEPEAGFKVGYFFDLSNGLFRLRTGSYHLVQHEVGVLLTLETTYTLRNVATILNIPITLVLRIFQKYLLSSVKKNAECIPV